MSGQGSRPGLVLAMRLVGASMLWGQLSRIQLPSIQLGTAWWQQPAASPYPLRPSLAHTIPHAHPTCASRWRDVKFAKKAALAKHIKEVTGYEVSTQPMFDVQVRGGRGPGG